MSALSRRALLSATVGAGVLAVGGRARGAAPASIGVVGGGIVGASIAMHLAEAGAHVTLFERQAPAAGATMNSFAWVNAFSDDAHYRDLRIESLLAYRELDRRLKLELVWGGYLDWAKDGADVEALHANAAMLARSRYATQRVTAAEIARLDPKLHSGPVTEAFYSKIDAHLDPVFVTQRYLDQASAHGAEIIYPCEVRGIELARGRLTGIRTTRGAFKLDRLVVAAGVDTPKLLEMAGFPLKLKHAPGILAHSVALPATTRLVHDAPGGLSFKQMANGTIVATDAPGPPDIAAHQGIRDHAMTMPPELVSLHGARILGKVAGFLPAANGVALGRLTLGFRPVPLDEFPVVGALPGVPDVHVAVTHSGVTLAPILGRYVTEEVLGAARVPLLAPYRPERFIG